MAFPQSSIETTKMDSYTPAGFARNDFRMIATVRGLASRRADARFDADLGSGLRGHLLHNQVAHWTRRSNL